MKKEYVGYKQGVCAKCGAKVEFEVNNWELDGEELFFYFTCHNCGAAGSENYTVNYNNTTCIEEE